MRLGKSLLLATAVVLSLLGSLKLADAGIVVDGGRSWSGWDLKGQSDSINVAPGVLGGARGSALNVYKVYTTTFLFDNHAKTTGTIGGGPNGGASGFETSASSGFTNVFKNGNRILGFGMEWISGATNPSGNTTTIRFDLDGNSEQSDPLSNTYYRAGTSIVSNNISGGQASFSTVSKQKDFTIQLITGSTDATLVGSAVSLQANPSKVAGQSTGNKTLILNRPAASGNAAGEWPFRIFRNTVSNTNNYQVFIDLDALEAQFAITNPVGQINFQGNTGVTWVGIGSTNVGTDSFSLNGYGDNDVAFGLDLSNIGGGGGGGGGVVPEPASAAIFALGAFGYGLRALKRSRKK
ncbi:MAG: PEP-CTERM sorting domain-containing protein [Pirellula sp.]